MFPDNVRTWTDGVPVDADTLEQIRRIAALPILAGHVAIMPDVHPGKGATVGSVIPTRGAIIPAAVGVDIGCGMCAARLDLTARDLPDNLGPARSAIESLVPVGMAAHREAISTHGEGLDGIRLYERTRALRTRFDALRCMTSIRLREVDRVWKQLGTLGGGNHFVELCLDQRGDVWVLLHSGSRNIGNRIGDHAIHQAMHLAQSRGVKLQDQALAWLAEGTPAFEEYVEGLHWAQDYAALNRDLMLHAVLKALSRAFRRDLTIVDEAVNCHHNYAAIEEHFGRRMWVTRKGAVSARAGEPGIIPGSMGTRSYIVRGKGVDAAYCSCSHGAGRRLSRGDAKRRFTIADLKRQTDGVECRKDAGVLDEIPGAYKNIDAVMAAQRDLVDVLHTLKQVLCVKG